MSRIAGITSLAFAGAFISSVALADSLPKTATPMSSESVTKLYSGNSAIWKNSDVYFAPDGTDKGVFGKPKITAVLMGTWGVSGNEICIYNFRNNESATLRDCYQYWQDGKRIITLWSKHSDGSAVDENNGYYGGEEKNLKPGDLVSEKYAAARGK